MIKIITVGKVKEKALQQLIEYYKKQVPRKVEVITVKDEPTVLTINKETESILKQIKEIDYVITLEIKGIQLSSEELSSKIADLELSSVKNITFIIGGSYGLGEEIIKRSNYALSFSKMTYPHQLMLLILMEQIYRSYMILSNHPYHK